MQHQAYSEICVILIFRNPFDVPRNQLLRQVKRMRRNLLRKAGRVRIQDQDRIHSQPVNKMGNYQDYLKLQASPLREVVARPTQQHAFGNPFKVNKVSTAHSTAVMFWCKLMDGHNIL